MRVRILWTIECEHSRSSFVPKLDGKNIETNVFVQKYNMRSHIVAWHLCPLVLPRVLGSTKSLHHATLGKKNQDEDEAHNRLASQSAGASTLATAQSPVILLRVCAAYFHAYWAAQNRYIMPRRGRRIKMKMRRNRPNSAAPVRALTAHLFRCLTPRLTDRQLRYFLEHCLPHVPGAADLCKSACTLREWVHKYDDDTVSG